MNFKEDIKLLLGREGMKEIKKHALISSRNNCKCGTCFCCTCLEFVRKSIYEKAKYLDLEIDHYLSDLYIRKTPLSSALIKGYEYKSNVSTFISKKSDKDIWYCVPFAYDPSFKQYIEKNDISIL